MHMLKQGCSSTLMFLLWWYKLSARGRTGPKLFSPPGCTPAISAELRPELCRYPPLRMGLFVFMPYLSCTLPSLHLTSVHCHPYTYLLCIAIPTSLKIIRNLFVYVFFLYNSTPYRKVLILHVSVRC